MEAERLKAEQKQLICNVKLAKYKEIKNKEELMSKNSEDIMELANLRLTQI